MDAVGRSGQNDIVFDVMWIAGVLVVAPHPERP